MSTDLNDLENQSLIVTNEGEEPFRGRYLNQLTVIEPTRSAIVSREAAVLWFGDPRLIDKVLNGRVIAERALEVERIKLRYGIMDITDPTTGERRTWDHVPKVRITNHSGEEFRFVVHDPAGETVTPAEQTVAENRILTEQINAMKSQLAALEARSAHTPAAGEIDEVPEDTPQASKQRRGQAS